MNKGIAVSNVQRFSVHDGPGIRTTVFLVGCSLHCPWCANPENIGIGTEIFLNSSKCVAMNNHCFIRNNCPILRKESDLLIDDDIKKCSAGALEKTCRFYTSDQLFDEILKDDFYIKDGGGVTFSGGEPLLQSENVLPLLQKLKQNGVDICFESCLCVDTYKLKMVLPYIDRMYVDIKLTIEDRFQMELGGNLKQYLENLDILSKQKIPIIVRFPVVPGVTDDKKNLQNICNIVHDKKIKDMEIFSVHNLAESKYNRMKMEFHHFQIADDKKLHEIANFFKTACDNVRIIKI